MASLAQIRELLREQDFEGLIAIGAPQDEYDAEAQMIAQGIRDFEFKYERKAALADVVAIIGEVWAQMFDLNEQDVAKRSDSFLRFAARLVD